MTRRSAEKWPLIFLKDSEAIRKVEHIGDTAMAKFRNLSLAASQALRARALRPDETRMLHTLQARMQPIVTGELTSYLF